MLVLKVWNLPVEMGEEGIKALFDQLVAVVAGIPAFEVKTENDFLILFPADRMLYGAGSEVLVEDHVTDSQPKADLRSYAQLYLGCKAVIESAVPGCKFHMASPARA